MSIQLTCPILFTCNTFRQTAFPAASEPIAYYRISDHYKYVMQQIFDCWQYPKLIILEVSFTTATSFNLAS